MQAVVAWQLDRLFCCDWELLRRVRYASKGQQTDRAVALRRVEVRQDVLRGGGNPMSEGGQHETPATDMAPGSVAFAASETG